MRGIIRNALLGAGFVAGLALLLGALSPVFAPKGNDRRDGMHYVPASGIDAEPPGTIDVLFVGDSECYFSFVPLILWRDLGCPAYVCGTPGQNLYDTVRWIKRACRNQSPRLIVLEADVLFNYFTYEQLLLDPLRRVFPLLEYHDRWKSLELRDLYARAEYTHVERNKGYVYDTSVAAGKGGEDYMSETDSSERISLLCRMYLNRVIDFCRARGIRLLLVSTPSSVNWNAARHNAVAALTDSLGLEYVDFNERLDEVGIDWKHDSIDAGYHLNFAGASKMTVCFEPYLSATGLLTDHRGEKAYKGWDKALKRARAKGEAL